MFKYSLLTFLFILIYSNEVCYSATTSLSTIQDITPVVDDWKHTSLIGTVTTPTIDGGIINTTDILPVSHPLDNPSQVIQINENRKYNSVPTVNNNININTKPFINDDWATSNRISNILENTSKVQKLQFVLQQSKILKLPASVALVPIVESAYQEKATSNKGAVGVWQLMPCTAKEYGLDPSQRSDFIPETKAALLLLKNLHQQFGNWELAFAAYNAGSTRVHQALNHHPNATTISQLNLPTETQNYVASIYRINNLLINVPINQFLS
jgi:hypothetical protein